MLFHAHVLRSLSFDADASVLFGRELRLFWRSVLSLFRVHSDAPFKSFASAQLALKRRA
jgi:hypothetical protein